MSDTVNSGLPLEAGPPDQRPDVGGAPGHDAIEGRHDAGKLLRRQQPVQIGLGRLRRAGLAGQILVPSLRRPAATPRPSGSRLSQRCAVVADSFCAADRRAEIGARLG